MDAISTPPPHRIFHHGGSYCVVGSAGASPFKLVKIVSSAWLMTFTASSAVIARGGSRLQ